MKVSVIIPVYNEDKFIERCLNSLINNNYPKNKLEILIFDRGSTDGTLDILKNYTQKYKFIKLFNNVRKHQIYALNKGIKLAQGDIIIRCDAHAEYPREYIKTLVKYHQKKIADNIGGCWEIIPGSYTQIAKAIAIALKSRLGMGSKYVTSSDNKPIYVNTVPFGSWRKDVFKKFGLFDTHFIRSQDYEHNIRIKKMGGKILLLPWLRIKYFARDSFLKLAKMSFQYGYAKAFVFKKHKLFITFLELLPSTLIIFFPICLPLYLLFFAPYSLFLAIKEKKWKITPLIFISFFLLHYCYALGNLKGIIDCFILGKNQKDVSWETTR